MKMTVFAAAGLLALAGCSSGHSDDQVLTTENNVEEANVAAPDANLVAPPPVVENVTNTATPAPPPAFSDEQQTRDDADASGLTSRVPDPEAQPVESGNQAQKLQ